jgi:hypothetical protein
VRDVEPNAGLPREFPDMRGRSVCCGEGEDDRAKAMVSPAFAGSDTRMEEPRLQGQPNISQLRLSVIQAKELISDMPHVACGMSLTLAKSMKS